MDSDTEEKYFRMAFDFAASIYKDKTARNLETLLHNVRRILRVDGFTWWFGRYNDYIEITTRDPAWMREYNENGYFQRDPMVRASYTLQAPFVWSELEALMKLDQAERELMSRGRELGMADGINFPVSGIIGNAGVLSFYHSRSEEILNIKNDPQLFAAINSIAMACNQASVFIRNEQSPVWSDLSPREVEVLRRAIRGMSNREGARDMGIEETTYATHCNSILRKLSVSNMKQAIGMVRSTDLLPTRGGAKPPHF